MSSSVLLAVSLIVLLAVMAIKMKARKNHSDRSSEVEQLLPIAICALFFIVNAIGVLMLSAFADSTLASRVSSGIIPALVWESVAIALAFYITRDDSKFIRFIGRHNEPGRIEKSLTRKR